MNIKEPNSETSADIELVAKWLRNEAGIESLSEWLKQMYSAEDFSDIGKN